MEIRLRQSCIARLPFSADYGFFLLLLFLLSIERLGKLILLIPPTELQDFALGIISDLV